jgi:hypothetical protein
MKQLIILSCVIPCGTQSEVKARTRLSEFRAMMNETFTQELQDETNTIIKWIILPIMAADQHSQVKVECIYPKGSSDNDILEKLGLLEEKTKRIKI